MFILVDHPQKCPLCKNDLKPATDDDFVPATVARRNDDTANRLRRCDTCSAGRAHPLLLDRDVSAALAMAFLALLQLLGGERPTEFEKPPDKITDKVKQNALRPARRSARLAAAAAVATAAFNVAND